jgi:serine/threonine-protein kinase
VILCGTVLVSLLGIGLWLFRAPILPERWLRVLEIVVFGVMSVFFAYWQFSVQTGLPESFIRALERVDASRNATLRSEPLQPLPNEANPPDPPPPDQPPPEVEPPVVPAMQPARDIGTLASQRNEASRDITAVHSRLRVFSAAVIVHFNWLLLIVFHAVLVPNTLARGVGVTCALTIIPLVIDTVVVLTHIPAQENALGLFALALTMLGAASGLAIFGTAKEAALQREVAVAREAAREMGQYRLRRKLGQGGMGEVYLAEHRMLKRPCALKRIHSRYINSPEQLSRFELEVQATSQLRHPNTIEIYDYGVAEDGTFYYVMEYLPGISLEELVGRFGPLPAERAVHLLRQVCGALREAHELGLVHRDIKPSNIIVFRAGSPHDQIKLVDFGLVHLLAEVDKPEKKITRDGLIVGTPEYMSPEQASGGVLDGRSDLFSLGSVAYYLLTGREAFHRENAMKTLLAVVSDTPKPISELNPLVPDDLVHTLTTCLAKNPDDRYPTATSLENALAACSCAQAWSEERSNAWWSSHPGAMPTTETDLGHTALIDPAGE